MELANVGTTKVETKTSMEPPKVTTIAATPKITTTASTPKLTITAITPKLITTAAAPKVTITAATSKVTTAAAAPKVTITAATPKVTTIAAAPKVTITTATSKASTIAAAPKVTPTIVAPKVTITAATSKALTIAAAPKVAVTAATSKASTIAAAPKVTTTAASLKVTTTLATPKVTTPAAAPKVTFAVATPKIPTATIPKITTTAATPRTTTTTATPKITTTATIPKRVPNAPAVELGNDQKRRSSSRSIKRKRFDDEIVEYSINFPQSRGEQNRVGRPRTVSQTFPAIPAPPPPLMPPNAPLTPATAMKTSNIIAPTTPLTEVKSMGNITGASKVIGTAAKPSAAQTVVQAKRPMDRPLTANVPNKRRRARSNQKKTKKTGRQQTQTANKDLGRWKPIDDLALIIATQQTNDLRMVHRGTKFSCKFTLQELQNRWYSLLYEPSISRIAVSAMRNLHPELIEAVQRKAPFSAQEEDLLGTLKSTDSPKLEQFQELIDKNAAAFYVARTAKSLQTHWQMMKQYLLLPDQVVKPLHNNDQPLSFSDAEDLLLDAELNEQRDDTLEIELALADRQSKREIRILENELGRWNVLVDSITVTGSTPEFDGQTLAILRGRLVRYLMRSKEITFGRDAKDCVVDVDLSLEGTASKISRRQGSIKLRSNGDFFIGNEGKRPIFIDGVPLLIGNKMRLSHNSVVEIAGLRFVFFVNYELINAIRHESAKTTAPLN